MPGNISAFPRPHSQDPSGWSYPEQDGMSLRDWFAGQALSNPQLMDSRAGQVELAAKRAYEVADAMLKAREA